MISQCGYIRCTQDSDDPTITYKWEGVGGYAQASRQFITDILKMPLPPTGAIFAIGEYTVKVAAYDDILERFTLEYVS